MTDLIRMFKDILYAGMFVLAAHYGYNLTDLMVDKKYEYIFYYIPWLLGVGVLLYLTKQRYDAEVKEAEESDGD